MPVLGLLFPVLGVDCAREPDCHNRDAHLGQGSRGGWGFFARFTNLEYLDRRGLSHNMDQTTPDSQAMVRIAGHPAHHNPPHAPDSRSIIYALAKEHLAPAPGTPLNCPFATP